MLCPACNAFASLSPICPDCGAVASDEGRVEDWNGPYSPYSPAIPLASSNSFLSEAEACLHFACCPQCGSTFTHSVSLWSLVEP